MLKFIKEIIINDDVKYCSVNKYIFVWRTIIYGNPSQEGSYAYQIEVTDALGNSAEVLSKSFCLSNSEIIERLAEISIHA
jgi:hypothetical protein